MKAKAGQHRAAIDEIRAAELDRETRDSQQPEYTSSQRRPEPSATTWATISQPLTFPLASALAGVL